MARRRKTKWACTRQAKGVRCNTLNPIRARKCSACGKDRPAVSKPKHMAALNASYEDYIEIQGGEFCGMCGITRAQTKNPQKKLMRDHVHTPNGLGEARGLLCFPCNLHLGDWYTIGRVRSMLAYLERHEARMAALTEDEEAA